MRNTFFCTTCCTLKLARSEEMADKKLTSREVMITCNDVLLYTHGRRCGCLPKRIELWHNHPLCCYFGASNTITDQGRESIHRGNKGTLYLACTTVHVYTLCKYCRLCTFSQYQWAVAVTEAADIHLYPVAYLHRKLQAYL